MNARSGADRRLQPADDGGQPVFELPVAEVDGEYGSERIGLRHVNVKRDDEGRETVEIHSGFSREYPYARVVIRTNWNPDGKGRTAIFMC